MQESREGGRRGTYPLVVELWSHLEASSRVSSGGAGWASG